MADGDEAPGGKTRSGQQVEGRGGAHHVGGWLQGRCWECAEDCGKVASSAQQGQQGLENSGSWFRSPEYQCKCGSR